MRKEEKVYFAKNFHKNRFFYKLNEEKLAKQIREKKKRKDEEEKEWERE